MKEGFLLKFLIGLLTLILGLNIWLQIMAGRLELPWIDNLLHFWGGFFVFGLYLWLILYSRFNKQIKLGIFFLKISAGLCFVALIGILWEFMEFVVDYLILKNEIYLGLTETNMYVDVISDLFFDLAGGLIAALAFNYLLKSRGENE